MSSLTTCHIFCPGDTRSHRKETDDARSDKSAARFPSLRRQTRTILDAVKHSLYTGGRKLATCIRNWNAILHKLAEPPRKRLNQMARLAQVLLQPGQVSAYGCWGRPSTLIQ